MWHLRAVKIALVMTLAAVAYGSTWVSFDTAPLDDRASSLQANQLIAKLDLQQQAALTDAELVETHARPLFSQNRRPFVPKPVVVEQPASQVEQPVIDPPASLPRRLSLIGTNVSGPAVSALVRNRESEEVRWLKIGDAFDGWILLSVTADKADFVCHDKQQSGDCEYRLALYADPGGE